MESPASPRISGLIVSFGLVLLLFSVVVAHRVRWHTDFKQLRGTSDKVAFSYYVGELLGGTLQPAGILVSNLEQARRVEAYLRQRIDSGHSLVKQYVSLASMVPTDVPRKREQIAGIAQSLQRVLAKDRLRGADKERVEELLQLARTKPWGVDDVPPVFRRRFETIDGKQQFVVAWPKIPTHVDQNIIRWGHELGQIRADLRARGLPVKVLDEHRVGARVLEKMRHDAPLVLIAAALAVLAILLLDFRNVKQVLLISGAFCVGLIWMVGAMAVFGIDLNVFNQAVLATVLGAGIDNIVHIKHRYLQEGPGSVAKVVATTGAAALLASATTAIGFGSAVIARHSGIQSFGALAIIGFSCTFASSTAFFPAVLALLERRRLRLARSRARLDQPA